MRWLKRILLGLIAVLAIAVSLGAVWHAWRGANDLERFPSPGELVDIGGRRLHLVCEGTGEPLVLIENGLTADFSAWDLVLPEIAKTTRVCIYDRAGLGFSDPSQHPTQARQVTEDFAALRAAAHLNGPTILVGWSAGGVFARHHIASRPDDIVGLVLVDSSHEQQGLRLPTWPNQEEIDKSFADMLRWCDRLEWTGLVRALGIYEQQMGNLNIPQAMREHVVAMFNRNGSCRGVAHEMEGFRADVRSTTPPQSLDDLPLVVLTRGRPSEAKDFPVAIEPVQIKEADDAWWTLQRELVALSTQSKQVKLNDSGHGIPFERPDAIVQAVSELVERFRQGAEL